MPELTQNQLEWLKDQMQQGKMTAAQANVEMVRMERVRIIDCRVDREIRTILNDAVKTGLLCHYKKNGYKPECYYHPDFEYLASGERAKYEQQKLNVLNKVAKCFVLND
jgi:hypothetical protein